MARPVRRDPASDPPRPPRRVAPRDVPPPLDLDVDEREAGRSRPATVDAWQPIPDDAMPRDIVLPRLQWVTRRGHRQWTACCPSHPDSRPSLSVTETPEGVLLLKCFSGMDCDAESVCTAVGLSLAHLFPTGYALRRARRDGRLTDYVARRPAADPDVAVDPALARLAEEYRDHRRAAGRRVALAGELGVGAGVLKVMGVGWTGRAWSIPERDDRGGVVGVVYRPARGERWCERGSRRGLIGPAAPSTTDTLYVCEGMSDTAAMLTAGRGAVGRPAASDTAAVRAWLARLVRERFVGRRVVVVGDRDEVGVAGARGLAGWLVAECGQEVRWALPRRPFKDVREQWVATGTVGLRLQSGGSA